MIRLPDGPYQRRARRPRRTPRLDGGRAVRALLAFALAFGSVTAVAGAEYGAFAAMGCYLDAYGTRDPRPRRALLTALLGGGFVLAFFAGSLAAGHTWAMVGVLSLVTAAATLFVDTLRLSGPGGYFVLLVAALAAFLPPADLTQAALRSGLVALGAACAWLFGSVGGRSPRNRPEQQAAAAALEEVAAFARVAGEAGPGRPGTTLVDAHRRACASLHRAWTALDDTRAGWRPHPPDARQLALHALLIRLEGVLVTVEQRLGEGGAAVPGRWPQRLSEAAGRVRAGCPPTRGPRPQRSRTGAPRPSPPRDGPRRCRRAEVPAPGCGGCARSRRRTRLSRCGWVSRSRSAPPSRPSCRSSTRPGWRSGRQRRSRAARGGGPGSGRRPGWPGRWWVWGSPPPPSTRTNPASG